KGENLLEGHGSVSIKHETPPRRGFVAGQVGIEPTTTRLTAEGSTAELLTNGCEKLPQKRDFFKQGWPKSADFARTRRENRSRRARTEAGRNPARRGSNDAGPEPGRRGANVTCTLPRGSRRRE